MWLIHSLLQEWLAASLLLPFMLVLLWAAAKWRTLSWLKRSRRRWLIIWGCYGLVTELAVGIVILVRFLHEFAGLDGLGWATLAVRALLNLRYTRGEILLSIVLGAIVIAAIDCGLASLAWWILSSPSRPPYTPQDMLQRYSIALLGSACALGIANDVNFWLPPPCYDCLLPYGFPFTFVREGGFVGRTIFVWKGVIANCLLMIAFGLLLGLVWSWRSQSHKRT